MTEWEKLIRYMQGAAQLLGSSADKVHVDPVERMVEVEPYSIIISEDERDFWIAEAVYDPGVRYHKDGSGTPPSVDILDVTCEYVEPPIKDGKLQRKTPGTRLYAHHAVNAVVMLHQLKQRQQLMEDMDYSISDEESRDD